MKQLSLFDHLRNLTIDKVPWNENEEVMKDYKPYMINKFIAMDDRFIDLVSALNSMSDLPNKTHYEMLFLYLPKANIFFNYINKSNKANDLKKLKIVAKYYRVSIKEAESIMNMTPDHILDELYELYYTSEDLNA